ncbi:MAG: hypothetical protein H6905_05420 [Hyphomicrobiales bacterium]|nr:hypothetical protein [Hyphomicrobiales bacterium]
MLIEWLNEREEAEAMDNMLMTLLAHLSAQRRLLINAYVCGFLDEPDPVEAAKDVQLSFHARPTQAPENGNGLDPALSDHLAALTDEAIDDFMDRVISRLMSIQDEAAQGQTVCGSDPLAQVVEP